MSNNNITTVHICILLIRVTVTVGGSVTIIIMDVTWIQRAFDFRARNVYFMYNMYSALKISSSSAAADII